MALKNKPFRVYPDAVRNTCREEDREQGDKRKNYVTGNNEEERKT